MPLCWKVFASLDIVSEKLGISFTVNEVESVWGRRISSKGRVTFRTKGIASPILKLNDITKRGWQGKYIFANVETLGLGDHSILISKWKVEGTNLL